MPQVPQVPRVPKAVRVGGQSVQLGDMQLLLAALLITSLAASPQPQLPPENLVAAEQLLPLLKDLNQRLQPHFRVWQGALPPSPFTGQRSAAVAISIGRKQVKVDESVRQALGRLVKWDPTSDPGSAEAILFDEWLRELRTKTAGIIAVKSDLTTCDTDCVVERLTRLDGTFGRSNKERQELRDYLMVEALTAAVK